MHLQNMEKRDDSWGITVFENKKRKLKSCQPWNKRSCRSRWENMISGTLKIKMCVSVPGTVSAAERRENQQSERLLRDIVVFRVYTGCKSAFIIILGIISLTYVTSTSLAE